MEHSAMLWPNSPIQVDPPPPPPVDDDEMKTGYDKTVPPAKPKPKG